jgi:hypothetical protein
MSPGKGTATSVASRPVRSNPATRLSDQGRQQPADLVGQLGMAGDVLANAGTLAGPEPRQKRFGNALKGIAVGSQYR